MFEDEDVEDESFEDFKKRQYRVREMPIYLKGKEIEKVARELLALIPDENEYLTDTKGMIQTDAYLLTAKTVNAEACDCLI